MMRLTFVAVGKDAPSTRLAVIAEASDEKLQLHGAATQREIGQGACDGYARGGYRHRSRNSPPPPLPIVR